MSTNGAQKQWVLPKKISVQQFEAWRDNLIYIFAENTSFKSFIKPGVKWKRQTASEPLRGFVDDDTRVVTVNAQTAAEKNWHVDRMLGQIANFCLVISRPTIVRESVSLPDVWDKIRHHYGIQVTGARILDLPYIQQDSDDSPEDLYQKLKQHYEECLLTTDKPLNHHGEPITVNEELTPSLENLLVLEWLKRLDAKLPSLVKKEYGPQLQRQTLASLKPEISLALPALLDQIQSQDEAKVMRASMSTAPVQRYPPARFRSQYNNNSNNNPHRGARKPFCPLCEAKGHDPNAHFLSKCHLLPSADKQYWSKLRQLAVMITEVGDDCPPEFGGSMMAEQEQEYPEEDPIAMRVQVRPSPFLDVLYRNQPVRIILDSGATGNVIKESFAKSLGVTILQSTQSAGQADGKHLCVVGETQFIVFREHHHLPFHALVVTNLECNILAGTPFLELNDITIRPARHVVILSDGSKYKYGNSQQPFQQMSVVQNPSMCKVRQVRPILLRVSVHETVWPSDSFHVKLPEHLAQEDFVAIQPRTDSPVCHNVKVGHEWPSPSILQVHSGFINIPNLSGEPISLKKNEHFCEVLPAVNDYSYVTPEEYPTLSTVRLVSQVHGPSLPHCHAVRLDPDGILSTDIRRKFDAVNLQYDKVFNPSFTGYNGAAGKVEAKVNMGPVAPPQKKGRVPQYCKDKLVELQHHFDQLEEKGVFADPEQIGITVEYLNPSFLVRKPNSEEHRLVTAFDQIAAYAKPQPSLLSDTNSILRCIAQWKHIAITDLTGAFHQLPLSRHSMKYCGVATPFKGVRVYVKAAMGIPGSECALEELMCRVIGDMIEEGCVTKIADDLYCGSSTPEGLLLVWKRLLAKLAACDLRLSARKTVIAPRSAVILGWTWSSGTLKATPHRISTLATCPRPVTEKALRSYLGSCKFLSRTLPSCASVMAPLENLLRDTKPKSAVQWSEESAAAFTQAQSLITKSRTLTLPQRSDQLWIVTDAAVKSHGIGAVMYVTRNGGKPMVAGYFSAKLKVRELAWLPCEVEALAISTAVNHFAPYIVESHHPVTVLTDSKPCVQACQRLRRGEFSLSPRVYTFLNVIGRYQITVRHVSGSANLVSDFASRNAVACGNPDKCQICVFIRETQDSVVLALSVSDIATGKVNLPYTSRRVWLKIQSDDQDLRRTRAHLHQGTRPGRKARVSDIKHYLNVATVANDGLLVVRCQDPFAAVRERIVIPRQVVHGLLTALHIQLGHPSSHQLHLAVQRFFYAISLDDCCKVVASACDQCAALRKFPTAFLSEQSTSNAPQTIGSEFAADVMRRERQMILVLRECTTSYTVAMVIRNEQKDTLRDALTLLLLQYRSLDGPNVTIRVDPAPGFKSLVNDPVLCSRKMTVVVGRIKNPNKNPVAERAIQELESELCKMTLPVGPLSDVVLGLAVSRLNSRYRENGLSSQEMWFQRNQVNNEQIPVNDQKLISDKQCSRLQNHPRSELSKSHGKPQRPTACAQVGDLVYIHSDRNKHYARPRYLVTASDKNWCSGQKFTGNSLRNESYRIKQSECYKVPTTVTVNERSLGYDSSDEEAFHESNPVNHVHTSNSDADIPVTPPELGNVYGIPPIPPELSIPPEEEVRRSGRVCRPSVKFKDFVLDMLQIQKLPMSEF